MSIHTRTHTSTRFPPNTQGCYSYVAVGANGGDYENIEKPLEEKLFFAGALGLLKVRGIRVFVSRVIRIEDRGMGGER